MCGVAGRFAVQGPLLGGRLDQGQFRLPALRRERSTGDYDYDYDYDYEQTSSKKKISCIDPMNQWFMGRAGEGGGKSGMRTSLREMAWRSLARASADHSVMTR